ncbi:flagellar hook-length control protein FliK [Hoeflea marina]|uniref:Flagellar hook-length control protein FliK n=1 Tax=Hoeflea marina TaxID=274592 RepID=A0A317PCD3_9HYPH|nr:flagellar hook-length control protein FliK [Hoeflea marina]PWV95248.1 flagellar hook-length control protein FliK [Hoeflea marina]
MNTLDMMLTRQVPTKAPGPHADAPAGSGDSHRGGSFATALMGHIQQAQGKPADADADADAADAEKTAGNPGKGTGRSLLFADEKALIALFAHLRANPDENDTAPLAEEQSPLEAGMDNEALAKALAALLGIKVPEEETPKLGSVAANDNPEGADPASALASARKQPRASDAEAGPVRPDEKKTVTVLAVTDADDAVDAADATLADDTGKTRAAPAVPATARPLVGADMSAVAANGSGAAVRQPGAADGKGRVNPDVAVSDVADPAGSDPAAPEARKASSPAERSRTFLRADPEHQPVDDRTVNADARSPASAALSGNAAIVTRGLSDLGRDIGSQAGPVAASPAAAILAAEQSRSQPLTMLKIQLNPLSLGHVNAVMRLTGETLTVDLQVETAEAYRQLNDDSQAIVKSLRAQGYAVEHVTIQHVVSDRAATQNGQPGGFSAGAQQGQGQEASHASAGGSGERDTRGNNQSNQSGTSANEAAPSSVSAAGRNDGVYL